MKDKIVIRGAREHPAPEQSTVRGRQSRIGGDKIIIRGAREHNLKNISLELPRNPFDKLRVTRQ